MQTSDPRVSQSTTSPNGAQGRSTEGRQLTKQPVVAVRFAYTNLHSKFEGERFFTVAHLHHPPHLNSAHELSLPASCKNITLAIPGREGGGLHRIIPSLRLWLSAPTPESASISDNTLSFPYQTILFS